jgi:hypothetical protein
LALLALPAVREKQMSWHPVDGYVAYTMFEMIEAFAKLEQALTDLRHGACTKGRYDDLGRARKHCRELMQHMDQMRYALERQEDTSLGEVRELKIT